MNRIAIVICMHNQVICHDSQRQRQISFEELNQFNRSQERADTTWVN
jgi:hypothetical protein